MTSVLLPTDAPSPSPFAVAAPALLANGYSPVPIRPDGKMPGVFTSEGWRIMRGWNRLCLNPPSPFEMRLWATWPDANVGVALGRGVIAFDIDRDEFLAPLRKILPPSNVIKKGRKGETWFYRADTSVIRSRGFRIDGVGVGDLIAEGKQTVIPASIHPDTGEPYVYLTEGTLENTRAPDLVHCPKETYEAVLDYLRSQGWEDERTHRMPEAGPAGEIIQDGTAASEWFRQLNEDALANLSAWVPLLGLTRLSAQGNGYRSVAEWRPSYSGRKIGQRLLHLSINPKGIVDYGDAEKGYTPIDLVMACRGLNLDAACQFLSWAIGYDLAPKMILNQAPKPPGHVKPQRPGTARLSLAKLPTAARAEDCCLFTTGEGSASPLPLGMKPRTLEELLWKERGRQGRASGGAE